MNRIRHLFAFSCILMMIGAGCSSEPVSYSTSTSALSAPSITQVSDTYVERSHPSTNYGSASLLRLRASHDGRVLLRFSPTQIQNLLAGRTLSRARLKLHILSNQCQWGRQNGYLDLHELTKPWTEHGATWQCANDIKPTNHKADCQGSSWDLDSSPKKT